ncbi:ras GTPase-activating protein-binding protein 2 isoform X3 [Sitodiplosis mosellana]|uniref:ras GTPase-activating protein-binding protein 2 isoform X3 n=1 Tax=Sitodiplosis mosellana TaxID=263140 RepID=UPI0024444FB2|nr:ras GTPase-activating protein-binding protein 2 isoform X3 [Sitodiplosis mosellana]XP_055323190.1 ras GTPase-activating protein-binding protein 2 isoform X3 [Sitodiplosis mosellana]XP_055323191.1 ras GTPase-activating protein-binding protein 2 isoform X3 [Sitodiplosis mosellana]XP_055323192.1 ras GTPase-activating protein-binding protein 2 isoform X3 [Sitodiplosis mosellana]
MIMEAVPSPQSVGREFVRQYYTLLNKAPDHLHRFYNNNSSFVHGGLDPHNREATMVIGQKQIYNKIQQLRFRDCHAKISQVDAQSTLGGGVVVQVTGELSNNGEPMRRFTQTFVLAAQSPKKYYVHNDIFRYQDLISDDEVEVESRSENDDEQEVDSGTGLVVDNKQPQPAAQLNGVVQHDEILQNLTPSNNNIAVNNVNNSTSAHTPLQIQSQTMSAQQQIMPVDQLATVGNQNVAVNDLENVSVPVLQNEIDQQNDVSAQASVDIESKDDLPSIQSEQNNINDNHTSADEVSKSIQSEPKTYAQFFKSDNFSSGINFVSSSATNTGRTPNTTNTLNSRSQSTRTGQIRERRSSNANQFSDNHQLFLGNVPHHATEEELKVMFGRFGTVVDLRIHSKPGPKIPGVRAPQNYGFITYEDPDSVQNCLANMPLYYPENSPDGQKLNVEEKKARMRNENSNNVDRNDRDRNDRGLGRTISGGQNRNSGDRDRGINLNRISNARPGGGNRPFNRNDRQQGPRGSNNPSNSASAGNGGGYARR